MKSLFFQKQIPTITFPKIFLLNFSKNYLEKSLFFKRIDQTKNEILGLRFLFILDELLMIIDK